MLQFLELNISMPNLKTFPELDELANSDCLVVNNYHGLYSKTQVKKYRYVIYTCFGEVFNTDAFRELMLDIGDNKLIILTTRKYLTKLENFQVKVFYVPSAYRFYNQWLHSSDILESKNIRRHVLSLNFRSQWNRLALAQFLTQENMLDKFYLSYHGHDRFNMGRRIRFDQDWGIVGKTWFNHLLDPDTFFQRIPIETDLTDPNSGNNDWTMGNIRYYNETFCSFVNETYIDENWDPFFTEKMFKPIAYGHPFMIFSSAGACKFLQDLGFETFPDVFDESYDQIESPQRRLEFLFNQIKRICCMDHEALQTMHRHLLPRLINNQRCLYQLMHDQYQVDIEKIKQQVMQIVKHDSFDV